MKRVITYGTFDLLHYGHINLLRRAKALGDYLIVVLSTDEFNWNEKRKKCYFSYEKRKQLLEDKADAFIITPGGVGTFDEFFEILTLKQLQQHNKAVAIFNVDGYYDDMLKMMQKSADTEFISDMTLELYQVFEDVDAMLDYLENYVPKSEDVYRLRNLLEEKM